jgi:NitT/TauT family transport system permease protein
VIELREEHVVAEEQALWRPATGFSARLQLTSRLRLIAPPLVATGLLIVLWYVFIWATSIRPLFLPTPLSVAEAFGEQWRVLLDHSWVTIEESALGLGLAVVIGAGLAVLIAEIPMLSRALMPLLIVSQAVPKVAVAPLFVIWFGFGLGPKIVIGFFIAFFPVVVSGTSGLKNMTRDEIDLFRTITPRRWPLYRHLKIPRALPQFFDGVKVASSLALIGAVVGEFVSADRGLGYLVTIMNRDLKTPEMFAVFFVLSLVGIMLFYAVVVIERLLIPWHFAMQRDTKVKGG